MRDLPNLIEFPEAADTLEDRLITAFMQEADAVRLERLQGLMERFRICRLIIEQLGSEQYLKKVLPQLMAIIENELNQ